MGLFRQKIHRVPIIGKIVSKINTYMWREHKISGGSKYPDKTFFVFATVS